MRISYLVIRISHLTLHATLSRFRHLALHESFPRNHQSKRAALTARFELCLARNSRCGVESRSWNAGLRRELNLQTHNPSTHVVTVDSLLHRREGRIILCLAANHIPEITRARHLGATEPTDGVLLTTAAVLLGAWFFTGRGFIFEEWLPANR